ncbi:MAG: hypothetical protein DRI69_05325 [Bacteroidetes bacterium]|nr:MAG: hypothetical protein DRI69_05325 [Bacteroidota bacterium]
MEEIRVSSSWTLFYKIFLPTVWIAFFGVLMMFIVFMDGMGAVSAHILIKLGVLLFFLSGLAILWFTLMDLKRVEMAEDAFYVTNYFKTYRYNYESLKEVKERDLLVLHITTFKFTEKTAFGRRIFFIQRRKVWTDFVNEHPHLLE